MGLDDGSEDDLFPGALDVPWLTPGTLPSSAGYYETTEVSLGPFVRENSGVTFDVFDTFDPFSIHLDFEVLNNSSPLDIRVNSLAQDFENLSCTLTLGGEAGGEFPGGLQSVIFDLQFNGDQWTPVDPLVFTPPVDPVPGSNTVFLFDLIADGFALPREIKPWVWNTDPSIFDFTDEQWVPWLEIFPDGVQHTQWHLWDSAPFLTEDSQPVLACTGSSHQTSEDWPNVQYGNSSRTALVSPALNPDIQYIQMIHAQEVEFLKAGTVMDGGLALWEYADGTVIPAEPVDGWQNLILPGSNNSLGGLNTVADSLMILHDNQQPQWRCDLYRLPQDSLQPVKLRLEFASNSLWRAKGWFIASMEVFTQEQSSAFPVLWQDDHESCTKGFYWQYPQPSSNFSNPVVEYFDAREGVFVSLPNQENRVASCGQGWLMPGDFILDELSPSGLTRHQLRVVADGPKGKVASRSIVVYPDGGAEPVAYLQRPFPNPSHGGVKFLAVIPTEEQITLGIYDLRGHRIDKKLIYGGTQQIFWDGTDTSGRRVASGTYYLKLEGSDFSSMHKVVLLK
ncbi:MAG: T9SS type A sorting domain-containing protein [bacterium]|nr:T9SS type A sorting domain-containing protein [bacterium]